MGTSYGVNPRTGRWALDCANCGTVGGVRRRTCPHKVLGDSIRTSTGQRYEMPYCYPAQLCGDCFKALKHELHKDCAEGAARSTAEYDQTERRYQAGEGAVIGARGDWADDVPDGMVGITVAYPGRESVEYVLPEDDYQGGGFLTDYPTARPLALAHH